MSRSLSLNYNCAVAGKVVQLLCFIIYKRLNKLLSFYYTFTHLYFYQYEQKLLSFKQYICIT